MLTELTLFISTNCPHCPTMLDICSRLVKSGEIARLEVINIEAATEMAEQYQIRSTPFIKIGEFDLIGLHSEQEIKDWLAKAGSKQGLADYYNQLFEQGELAKVVALALADSSVLTPLLSMLGDLDTPLTSRIGIAAVFEDMPAETLSELIPTLCEMAASEHASVRVDMCYILGLSHSQKAVDCLTQYLQDEFADVRESAEDALEMIRSA